MEATSAAAMRTTTRLTWGLFAITLCLSVMGMSLFFVNRHTPVQGTWGTAEGVRDAPLDWLNLLFLGAIIPLTSAALGALILTHHARNRIGWLLLLAGLVAGLNISSSEWTVLNYFTLGAPLVGSGISALISNGLWIFPYSLVILAIALFPNGRFLSLRWQRLITLSLALFVVPTFVGSMGETPLSSAYQLPHPFLTESLPIYDFLFVLGIPFMPLSVPLAFGALFFRFRRAGAVERQQIKWLLGFIALMVLTVMGGLSLASASPFPTVGEVIVNGTLLFPILGIGIAILRYRLYDIDVIINRALVYSVLTGSLLLLYFGSVVLLQRLLAPLVGSESNFAIVLSTLAIAALFNPLRQTIQTFIDRRFYRRRYDAQRVLATFAASLRAGEMAELEHLTANLVQVIDETVQPAHVGVWLREGRNMEGELR